MPNHPVCFVLFLLLFLYLCCCLSTELSFAVPLTNGLTFLFTALAGRFLGERPLTRSNSIGMLFVLFGVCLFVAGRYDPNNAVE